MLTDPNALAAKAAEHAYCAGNLVTCDGYYEFDLDAAQAAIAAVYAPRLAELEAEVARLRGALEVCAAELYAPDPACSCHIHPPCGDCTDYGSIREAIDFARTALGASHDADA